MRSEDIREYAHRRWDLIAGLKAAFWAEEKARLTAVESLQIAEALRQHVLAIRPDWPSATERAQDLESHATVARKLRLAGQSTGR